MTLRSRVATFASVALLFALAACEEPPCQHGGDLDYHGGTALLSFQKKDGTPLRVMPGAITVTAPCKGYCATTGVYGECLTYRVEVEGSSCTVDVAGFGKVAVTQYASCSGRSSPVSAVVKCSDDACTSFDGGVSL